MNRSWDIQERGAQSPLFVCFTALFWNVSPGAARKFHWPYYYWIRARRRAWTRLSQLCENESELYYVRMPKRILPCYFPIMDPHPRAPLLPSLLQKEKKPSCQPFFLKPVKEGRARATRKKEKKEGEKREEERAPLLNLPTPTPLTTLHPPAHPPTTLLN